MIKKKKIADTIEAAHRYINLEALNVMGENAEAARIMSALLDRVNVQAEILREAEPLVAYARSVDPNAVNNWLRIYEKVK